MGEVRSAGPRFRGWRSFYTAPRCDAANGAILAASRPLALQTDPREHVRVGYAESERARLDRRMVMNRPHGPPCLKATAVVFAVTTLTACRAHELSPADREAIHAVLERQRDAWNAGDVDRFMDGYQRSAEIVFTSGGKIRRGYEATLAAYRDRYADRGAMGYLEFRDVEIQDLGGDAAVVLGHFEVTESPEANAGVFSLVFVHGDSGWRIVHDHSSRYDEPAGQ
jgi:beta-aspartyl-peptidase (threonine type)